MDFGIDRSFVDVKCPDAFHTVIDWSLVGKEDYLFAMERSPVRDTEIKVLLKGAFTDKVDDRQVYMKGIDASYRYEGYSTYTMDELDDE